jgi:putative transposase
MEHLTLEVSGSYTVREIFEILVHTASRGDSLEHTVRTLEGAASGNSMCYHWEKLDDLQPLEGQFNAALQSLIPAKIRQGRHRLAIDLHLIAAYGPPQKRNAPLSTVRKLKQDPQLQKFLSWVHKQDPNKRVKIDRKR